MRLGAATGSHSPYGFTIAHECPGPQRREQLLRAGDHERPDAWPRRPTALEPGLPRRDRDRACSARLGAVLEAGGARCSSAGPGSAARCRTRAAIASEAGLDLRLADEAAPSPEAPCSAEPAGAQDGPVRGIQRARRPPPIGSRAGSRPPASPASRRPVSSPSQSLPVGVTVMATGGPPMSRIVTPSRSRRP